MLRDYQEKMLNKATEAFKLGHKRILIVAPCGAGKSYLFMEMARKAAQQGEVLILVHRIELKDQHTKLFEGNGISLDNIRIEMVLTEANHLNDHEPPCLIICDEAHLSKSNSWQRIIEHYDSPCLGFSATPLRLDGKPLGDIYSCLVDEVSAKYLIENKRLAPYEYYAPTTLDVSALKSRCGDYAISDVEDLVINRKIFGDVISSYKRIAGGKKAIAYCVSVKHSKEVAKAFNEANIAAEHIDGETPAAERAEIMERFRNGEIKVLCNCMLIIEGISIDDCECCLLLRPTQSLALYIQSSMRCMRYQPNKTAIILDFVGNYTRHGMPDEDREWSLEKKTSKKSEFSEDGTFSIRTCPNCYRCFKSGDTCPWCGEPYPLHPREIEAIKEIELKRINEEEAEKAEAERKKKRREVGMARTRAELEAIARERGYNPKWVFIQCKHKGIKY